MHTFNISIKKNKLFANSAKTKQHSRWTNSTTLCKKIYSKRKKKWQKRQQHRKCCLFMQLFTFFFVHVYTLHSVRSLYTWSTNYRRKKKPSNSKNKIFFSAVSTADFPMSFFSSFCAFHLCSAAFFSFLYQPFFINYESFAHIFATLSSHCLLVGRKREKKSYFFSCKLRKMVFLPKWAKNKLCTQNTSKKGTRMNYLKIKVKV